uniref:NodB homology domain-containing protein n=1 Tax=Chromera velia CCMP2878 TaxID=1169474 RepID=A0A0G4HL04_9ALVE|eukprot:Cvel_28617.t1-p1 / transcript=Cvel_28617.t1 / gene=Cvel_28617 / organism=Chromera_velia_CCMP2878 / gene_product=Chitin deacetylase 1, putative / transcript_product=Chitin deacetylase 1, putative / location=Cvel_scaffold3776:9204-13869(-) / protein_length=261 / sequence_SO=supercontig / SO=protein_coding / is_pseudo=false
MNMESLYEYGSRAGFWRLHRLFTSFKVPLTVYACSKALEEHPEAGKAMLSAGWEVASHGHRWIDYQNVPEAEERDHIKKCVEVQKKVIGVRPLGFYQGKPNVNTRRYMVEQGGFLYDNDHYNDDLPYWVSDVSPEVKEPLLIIPYTLDCNDMRFCVPQGFNSGDQFFQYLKDSFDFLYREGKEEGSPKMMTVGLHCRIVGRPGRCESLRRFLQYIQGVPDVWVTTRLEIAKHWYSNFFPPGAKTKNPLEEKLSAAGTPLLL